MDSLEQAEIVLVFITIEHLILSVVEGIIEVFAQRYIDDQAHDPVPPIIPVEIVRLSGRELAAVISAQRDHLQESWSAICIDAIEHDHKDTVFAYKNQPIFKLNLDNYNEPSTF